RPGSHRSLRATAGATGEHARSPPSSQDRFATGPPVATPGVADTVDETTYARRVASRGERGTLEVAGRHIPISNPGKMYFPEARITKVDVARYYLAVAEGALHAAGGRPNVLVRYPNGIHGEFFYQKRAPSSRPAWIEVVTLAFPSGRTAEEVVPRDAAALAW